MSQRSVGLSGGDVLSGLESPRGWWVTVAARAQGLGRWLAFCLAATMLGGAGLAQAAPSTQCPTPVDITVPSGGNFYKLYMDSSCSPFGLGDTTRAPSHGTLQSTLQFNAVDYTNNGDGALSDTFSFLDDMAGEIVYNVTITPPSSPITLSPVTLPAPSTGNSYSQTLAATGGVAPYTYSVASGSLPAGMSLSTSGTLSGTPTAAGPFTFTVKVQDSTTPTALTTTKSYSVTVPFPVLTLPPSLPGGVVSTAYSQQLSTGGGTAPYTYSIQPTTGKILPPGISLSTSGLLSGTPTATGSYTFSVKVMDSTSGTGPAANAYDMTIVVTAAPVIDLTPTTVPPGQAGASYSATLTGSGGSAPYTFVVSAGALPQGLSLSPAGVLSGTSTAVGSFTFTAKATDASAQSGARAYVLTMAAPTITLSPVNLPAMANGVDLGPTTVSASGGTAPYTYSVAAGAFPAGVTMAANGTVSGSPTAAGAYSVTVRATDRTAPAGSYFGERLYTGTVSAGPPVAGDVSATVAYGSTANPVPVNASGGASVSAAIVTAALHGTATASGTSLSYTPTAGYTGPDSFIYTLTNGAGTSAPATVTLTVLLPTVVVTPSTGWSAQSGAAYSQTLTWSGGHAPYSAFSATGLPAGLTVTGTTANSLTISGTPTQAGSFWVSVSATDSSTGNGPLAVAQTSRLTVAGASVSLAPAGTGLTAVYGAAYSQAFTASGGVTPYTYTMSGRLPNGLSWNAGTGVVSGTPVEPGTFPFTVTATDRSTGVGAPVSASLNYTLNVGQPIIALTPASVPGGTPGQAYSTQIMASGGVGPYTYALQGGGLPPGVSFNTTGLLSGRPTATGSFNFTVRATDNNGFLANQAYTLVIGAPTLTLTPAALPSASAGAPYSVTMVAGGGTGPYSYGIAAGSLPAGLTLNAATGVLSGTTVAVGSFPVSVRATDSTTGTGAPFSLQTSYTLVVNAPSLSLSPATVPGGMVGASYAVTFATSGGTAPYTYSVTGGVLPAGVTLGAGNVLSGTPRAAGSFNATVQVTDANGFTASQAYTLTIAPPTLSLTPVSLSTPTAGTAYSATLTASGGTAPYAFAVSSGALPAGLAINPTTGVLSGTATVAGTFTFSVRALDSSTGVGAPFSSTVSYTMTVAAPTITVNPASVPDGKVNVAYSQAFTAVGGSAPYVYTVTSGATPPGLTLSSTGILAGTPTSANSFSFTVRATDKFNFTGEQALTVAVGQPTPVAVDDTASTPANQSVTVPVTANDSGPIASVAITTAPAHGTATVSGLNLVYTPANNFFGTDTLRYTATGPGGTSAPATLTVTVVALPVPVALPQTATVLAGQPVTVHAAQGATGGPFTAVAITSPPATGSAAVSGTDIVYTPAADGSGDVRFSYTLANAFGVSAPVTATVTVNPLPQAGAHDATVSTGAAVNIDLMPGATGGPFNAATVVSLAPAAAGTAVIRDVGTAGSPAYQMTFTAASTFTGSAVVSYTLRNAYATSAPGRVTVTVTPRRDMSADAEVTGLLAAQASSARRFASTQLSNFSRRLESLHGDGWGRSDFGISLAGLTSGAAQEAAQQPGVESDRMVGSPFQSGMRKTGWSSRKGPSPTGFGTGPGGTAMAAAEQAAGNALPNLPEPRDNARQAFSWWVGGAIDYGRQDANNPQEGYKFTTNGLSLGGDYRLSDRATIGLGAGFSSDSSKIGSNGSKSSADSAVAVVYGSLRPARDVFIDGVLGYGKLSFDTTRYITGVGGFASGSRRGDQVFGSLSTGVEYRGESWMWSPYGRLELSSATLDAYTETAQGLNALTYFKQTVRSTNGILGLRAEGHYVTGLGLLVPRLRVEFNHRFEGADEAGLSYADLAAGGPAYIVRSNGQDIGNWTAGLGARLVLRNGVALSLDFNTNLNMNRGRSQSIMFGVAAPF